MGVPRIGEHDMRGKYIIVHIPFSGNTPILFSEYMCHSDFRDIEGQGRLIVRAGFFVSDDEQVSCTGGSITLGIDSYTNVAEDKDLIAQFLGLGKYH